jgi:UDPglucose 6-dehydrogenase
MDPRIGLSYLQSGLGFGGSCLRKDTLGLAYLAELLNLPEVASYWKAVVDINTWQVERFVERIIGSFHGSLRGNKLAIFGYAFKENTSDSRETQSIEVIRQLLQEQPDEITIYDPGCDPDFMQDELLRTLGPISGLVKTCRDPYEACEGASAVLILTPWEAFKYPPRSVKSSPVAIVEKDNLLISHPDGHIKLTLSGNMESQEGYLNPGPDCPSGCAKCGQELAGKRSSLWGQPVNWEIVLQHMKQPRWVFDARRQVQAEELERLGCKVVTVGQRASV